MLLRQPSCDGECTVLIADPLDRIGLVARRPILRRFEQGHVAQPVEQRLDLVRPESLPSVSSPLWQYVLDIEGITAKAEVLS